MSTPHEAASRAMNEHLYGALPDEYRMPADECDCCARIAVRAFLEAVKADPAAVGISAAPTRLVVERLLELLPKEPDHDH